MAKSRLAKTVLVRVVFGGGRHLIIPMRFISPRAQPRAAAIKSDRFQPTIIDGTMTPNFQNTCLARVGSEKAVGWVQSLMEGAKTGVSMVRTHCQGCAVFQGLVTDREIKFLVEQVKKSGWQRDEDTVDGKATYQNNLKDKCPDGFKLLASIDQKRLQPLLSKIFPNQKLHLTGHFIRHYSPSTRTRLMPHQDKSVCTVNILLSTRKAFTGGDIFVFDLESSISIRRTHPDFNQEIRKLKTFGLRPYTKGRVRLLSEEPDPPDEIKKRVVEFERGEAMIHRGEMFHGVTPVSEVALMVFVEDILDIMAHSVPKERAKKGERKEQELTLAVAANNLAIPLRILHDLSHRTLLTGIQPNPQGNPGSTKLSKFRTESAMVERLKVVALLVIHLAPLLATQVTTSTFHLGRGDLQGNEGVAVNLGSISLAESGSDVLFNSTSHPKRHHHHRDDRNSIPDGSKNQNPTLRSHTTRTRLKPAYHSNRSKTTKHALVARKTKARKTNPRPDIICLWLHGAGTRLEKSKWDDEVIVSFNDDPYKHWFMPLDFSDKRYTVPVKMKGTSCDPDKTSNPAKVTAVNMIAHTHSITAFNETADVYFQTYYRILKNIDDIAKRWEAGDDHVKIFDNDGKTYPNDMMAPPGYDQTDLPTFLKLAEHGSKSEPPDTPMDDRLIIITHSMANLITGHIARATPLKFSEGDTANTTVTPKWISIAGPNKGSAFANVGEFGCSGELPANFTGIHKFNLNPKTNAPTASPTSSPTSSPVAAPRNEDLIDRFDDLMEILDDNWSFEKADTLGRVLMPGITQSGRKSHVEKCKGEVCEMFYDEELDEDVLPASLVIKNPAPLLSGFNSNSFTNQMTAGDVSKLMLSGVIAAHKDTSVSEKSAIYTHARIAWIVNAVKDVSSTDLEKLRTTTNPDLLLDDPYDIPKKMLIKASRVFRTLALFSSLTDEDLQGIADTQPQQKGFFGWISRVSMAPKKLLSQIKTQVSRKSKETWESIKDVSLTIAEEAKGMVQDVKNKGVSMVKLMVNGVQEARMQKKMILAGVVAKITVAGAGESCSENGEIGDTFKVVRLQEKTKTNVFYKRGFSQRTSGLREGIDFINASNAEMFPNGITAFSAVMDYGMAFNYRGDLYEEYMLDDLDAGNPTDSNIGTWSIGQVVSKKAFGIMCSTGTRAVNWSPKSRLNSIIMGAAGWATKFGKVNAELYWEHFKNGQEDIEDAEDLHDEDRDSWTMASGHDGIVPFMSCAAGLHEHFVSDVKRLNPDDPTKRYMRSEVGHFDITGYIDPIQAVDSRFLRMNSPTAFLRISLNGTIDYDD
ncbi:hypothetical protein AAMO2058_001442700 [Amorphochlora amoebiformis]